jgi:hypothetical protein
VIRPRLAAGVARLTLDPVEGADAAFWETMASEPDRPAGLVDALQGYDL